MRFIVTLFCILLSQSANASDLNLAELDALAKAQQYQAISKSLRQYPQDDKDVLSWLRSHKEDWNPPLMAELSFRLLSQLQKTPSKEVFDELTIAYGRAKTGFFIDRSDCKERTRQTKELSDVIGLLDQVIMNGFKPSKPVVAGWGLAALDWSKKVHAQNQMAPAIWLCGENNLLSEKDRLTTREKNHNELGAQIKSLLQ